MTQYSGSLINIHIAPKESAPMVELTEARLIAGRGIEGDRYNLDLNTGKYSAKPDVREVTLIEEEVLVALMREVEIDLPVHEHRHNLTTRGVPLNHLVGVQFRVGETILEGGRLNFPCLYLQDLLGKRVYQPLLNRSGLNCSIVEGGTIRPGDPITPI